ncbi:MAG: amidohydrolase family protein [Chloroflexi bacterium]|nr:amidohydrolase family protein [Chloroflexota bacterium]
MKKVVVLGAGMVGSAIAADLCREYEVTAVDRAPARTEVLAARYPLAARTANLADPAAVRAAIAGADLVIGAVPGFMGFATLRTVIETGVNVVDISFFDDDPFELDALARDRSITAVVDCGVAPGLSHMILGYHAGRMTVESFRCLVGGLPVTRSWPWQYKAPFSPIDVLEEYTRPARLMENGKVVTRPALSDPELVEIEPVGTLEAFNTDGLRSLLKTMTVPNMVEKTLRYPGHIELMRILRESGFLGKEPVTVGGARVSPIDVTTALLFPRWRLEPGEPEFTAMEITVQGQASGQPRTVAYHLFDRSDSATGISSMARTTGYTCTAVARLVLEGIFARQGICPPEYVGADEGCFKRVIADLQARGVVLRMNSQPDTVKPAEAGCALSPQPASASFAYQTPNSFGGPARLALLNGRVALPDRIVEGQAVVIEGETILGLAAPGDLAADIVTLDAGGRLITPGLVDIHTHGALGRTFNEPNADAWATITAENARRGVTSLLATLAAAPIPDLVACLDFARAWMQSDTPSEVGWQGDGVRVLGVHLESPYISPAQRGALDLASLRSPDDGSAAALLAYADVLKLFVLAPELPGALDLVTALTGRGVIVAAGHSSAKDEQVLAAMRRGLRHVTHIWSSMSSTVREGPWRVPGLLETALAYDGLTVEMIADNRHLPPTLMKLAYKCLGADRLCAVSDAMNGAGLPEGARFRVGGMEYEVHDGVGMVLDRTAFAGSATLLSQMIPILTGVVGIPLVEAVRMVTLTPARAIGMEGRLGSIAAGKAADLAIFDDNFAAWRVMIGGRWCENSKTENGK